MKKVYVKPVMESEEFVTNSYVAACAGFQPNGMFVVSKEYGTWNTNWNDSDWNGNTTEHTFNSNDPIRMVNQTNNTGQNYYACTCHGNYYLEFSSATNVYGSDAFFLYKDASNSSEKNGRSGVGTLQVAMMQSGWPGQTVKGQNTGFGRAEYTSDFCLAKVQFANGQDPIISS